MYGSSGFAYIMAMVVLYAGLRMKEGFGIPVVVAALV